MDLVLKNIRGVNEGKDPETLDSTEVTVLNNLVLNKKFGQPVKRGGLNIFNANSATTIQSLHDVVDSGGTNYLVGQIGTTFQKSSAGTGSWSTIKSGLTTGQKTRIQAYNNYHYVTNGVDAPFTTELTTSYSLSVAKPDVTSVTTRNNGAVTGLTANAKYYWVLVYVTATGEYSAPSAPITHFCNATGRTTTDSTYQSVVLGSLPVSSDPRVVRRLIFRTEGNGSIFYLCQSIDNVTTTWTDFYADTILDKSEYIPLVNTISTAKYITAHQDRIFLANGSVADPAPDMVYGTVSSPSASNGYSFRGVATTGGSLGAGTYYYKIVYVDSENKVSASRASISVVVGAPNNAVQFYSVPTPLISEYQIRLYRSTDNVTFYYLPNVDPRDSLDTGVVASSETLPSATSTSTAFKSGVFFSEVGKPSQFNDINLIQIFPDDGDEITGIIDDSDGVMVVKRTSICKIYTLGSPLNWRVQKIVEQIGCDEPNSLQKVGNRVYFVSNKQVYRYPDKINVPLSAPKKTTLATLTTLKDSAYSNYYQWYILLGSFGTNKAIVYDELLDCWYDFSTTNDLPFNAVLEKTLGTTKGALLFGYNYINKYDESVSLDYSAPATTQDITATITSKVYTMEEPTVLFRPRVLFVDYKKKDDSNVAFTLANPQDNTASLTVTDSTNSTISSDYKNYRKETDAMTGTFKEGNKLTFTASGAGLTEFNAMRFHYRILNRGRRVV